MVELLEKQPQQDGELVFDAPWQARTFAMTVQLHQSGLFTWQEWSEHLATNIRKRETDTAIESNDDYYTVWQQTLEEMLRSRVPGDMP